MRHERQALIVNKFDLAKWKSTCGTAGVVLAIAGLAWFLVCFSAPEAKWWNSLCFFFIIFLFSLSLGIIGRKTNRGIVGILVGSLGFIGVSLLLYIGRP
jgi:hypothetical protein